jgi:hypothetical protein
VVTAVSPFPRTPVGQRDGDLRAGLFRFASCLPRHGRLASSVVGSSARVSSEPESKTQSHMTARHRHRRCCRGRENTTLLGQGITERWQHSAAEAASGCGCASCPARRRSDLRPARARSASRDCTRLIGMRSPTSSSPSSSGGGRAVSGIELAEQQRGLGPAIFPGQRTWVDLKKRKKFEPASMARLAASASSIILTEVIPLLPSAAGQSL